MDRRLFGLGKSRGCGDGENFFVANIPMWLDCFGNENEKWKETGDFKTLKILFPLF